MSDFVKVKKKIDMQIGKRIREARATIRMTQVELGTVIGVSGKQISKYELGEASCAAWQIKMIAEGVGTSVEYLVNGCDAEQKSL